MLVVCWPLIWSAYRYTTSGVVIFLFFALHAYSGVLRRSLNIPGRPQTASADNTTINPIQPADHSEVQYGTVRYRTVPCTVQKAWTGCIARLSGRAQGR